MHFKHRAILSVTSQWPLVSTKCWKISVHLSPTHTWDYVTKVSVQRCPLRDNSPPVPHLWSHLRYRKVFCVWLTPGKFFSAHFFMLVKQSNYSTWCGMDYNPPACWGFCLNKQVSTECLDDSSPLLGLTPEEGNSCLLTTSWALNQLLVVRCHKIHISLRDRHVRELRRTSWN